MLEARNLKYSSKNSKLIDWLEFKANLFDSISAKLTKFYICHIYSIVILINNGFQVRKKNVIKYVTSQSQFQSILNNSLITRIVIYS